MCKLERTFIQTVTLDPAVPSRTTELLRLQLEHPIILTGKELLVLTVMKTGTMQLMNTTDMPMEIPIPVVID